MPYHIERKNGKHCVIKDADGSTEKCHMTAAQAKKHMAALYANEKALDETDTAPQGETIAEKATDGTGDGVEVKMMDPMYVPYGVTSFSELQAARDADHAAMEVSGLAGDLQGLLGNRISQIMMDDAVEDKAAAIVTGLEELAGELAGLVETEAQDMEMEKGVSFKDWLTGIIDNALKAKPMKTVDGKKYPASDFLVAEDSQSPSTWHLQVSRNGKPDRGLAGAAWAALFSPGGHRGNKYAGPGKAEAGKKLRAFYKRQGWEEPGAGKESGLLVWKEGDRYRWLAVFSNKYRDRDNPPEILADAAHKEFIAAVDKGEWPMPELWHWHVPGTRWGVADWLAYDESSGFTLASGWVDDGHEKEAAAVAGMDEIVLTSHGMPIVEIIRDRDDPTVIVRYRTKEISDLLEWAAANPLTSFQILSQEVNDMAIPAAKKEYLLRVGLTDERITQIEADLEGKAKEANDQGLEFKGTEAQEAVKAEEVPPPAEPVAEAPAEAPLTRAEVAEALTALTGLVDQMRQSVEALAGEVKALKESDEDKVAAKAAATPAASLVDLVRGRAVGAEEARIDGRKVKGPKETKEQQVPLSPVPFLNQLITSQQQQ